MFFFSLYCSKLNIVLFFLLNINFTKYSVFNWEGRYVPMMKS